MIWLRLRLRLRRLAFSRQISCEPPARAAPLKEEDSLRAQGCSFERRRLPFGGSSSSPLNELPCAAIIPTRPAGGSSADKRESERAGGRALLRLWKDNMPPDNNRAGDANAPAAGALAHATLAGGRRPAADERRATSEQTTARRTNLRSSGQMQFVPPWQLRNSSAAGKGRSGSSGSGSSFIVYCWPRAARGQFSGRFIIGYCASLHLESAAASGALVSWPEWDASWQKGEGGPLPARQVKGGRPIIELAMVLRIGERLAASLPLCRGRQAAPPGRAHYTAA